MIDFNDSLTVLSVIILIISGGIASVYYIDKTIRDKKSRTPIFGKFQRTRYGDGSWSILLHSPNIHIARCNATFGDVPLYESGSDIYEKNLTLEEGITFLIPHAFENDDRLIKIRDGDKVIAKEKFNAIPIRQ